jgi:hypothetical protein
LSQLVDATSDVEDVAVQLRLHLSVCVYKCARDRLCAGFAIKNKQTVSMLLSCSRACFARAKGP